MLVSLEQALAGGDSQCRNPAIQHQFVLVGLGERAGSTVPWVFVLGSGGGDLDFDGVGRE